MGIMHATYHEALFIKAHRCYAAERVGNSSAGVHGMLKGRGEGRSRNTSVNQSEPKERDM